MAWLGLEGAVSAEEEGVLSLKLWRGQRIPNNESPSDGDGNIDIKMDADGDSCVPIEELLDEICGLDEVVVGEDEVLHVLLV
jgi:hypothetical protein